MKHSIASPVVICFYTLDTPYEQEVLNLINSCKKWGVELCVEGILSQGGWEANCNYKPIFILQKLKELKRPVFWADADSVFLQKPSFDQFFSCDISVRKMEIFENDPRYTFNTASFFANYTSEAINFLEKWADICRKEPNTAYFDQLTLHALLTRSDYTLSLYPMPISYCKIFDIDSFFLNDADVVLEQTQASRKYRKQ